MTSPDLWDTLSEEYDRFVNWEQRLAGEMPFLESALGSVGARRVLDAACGTGHHALALAQKGYQAVGADISAGMIRRARENARRAGAAVIFHQAPLGGLRQTIEGRFDAVLCLGNSLPSLLSEDALGEALVDVAGLLHPGGLFIVQNLNYDRLWPRQERFLPLVTHRQGAEEWLFWRLMDFHQRTLTFNMIIFHQKNEEWDYRVGSTELRPIFRDELQKQLPRAGFSAVESYGDYAGHPYERDASGDLILIAHREAAPPAPRDSTADPTTETATRHLGSTGQSAGLRDRGEGRP
jgi:glycine/sarcosine N-methyltransferase